MWLLPVLPVTVFGQDNTGIDAGDLAEAEEASRFMNLLEFLGEFSGEDGEWIDPAVLEQEAFAVLDEENPETDAAGDIAPGGNTLIGRSGEGRDQ